MNTRMNYLYRDASNYKVWNEAVFEGEITPEEIDMISDSLEDGMYFIPEQIDLPVVRFGTITEDDHCYCELNELDPRYSFELTDEIPTEDRTIHELAQDFADVTYWDCVRYAV